MEESCKVKQKSGVLMHYYKRNIGDYAKRAGKLGMLQHGSYTLLIDSCYDREQFPTLEQAIEWTWALTREEIEAVTFVLKRFFMLEDGVYVHTQIKDDIADYHAKARTNKRIATEREMNRKENNVNRAQVVNKAPPNHEPLTINHKPVTKVKNARALVVSIDLPNWINKSHWDTWHSSPNRKAASNAQKQIAIGKLTRWRNDGLDHDKALEDAAAAGWQGLVDPKPKIKNSAASGYESPYSASQRKKFEVVAPMVAAQNPNLAKVDPNAFLNATVPEHAIARIG